MKTWTVDEMLSHNPCPDYPRERLVELWAGRERLSVVEIAELPIPIPHRLWALFTDGPHVSLAIERIATRAVRNHAQNCGIEVVEKWAADWLCRSDRSRESAMSAARAARAAEYTAAARAAAPLDFQGRSLGNPDVLLVIQRILLLWWIGCLATPSPEILFVRIVLIGSLWSSKNWTATGEGFEGWWGCAAVLARFS